MKDEIRDEICRLVEKLLSLAETDDDVRTTLQSLAQKVARLTEPRDAAAMETPAASVTVSDEPAEKPKTAEPPVQVSPEITVPEIFQPPVSEPSRPSPAYPPPRAPVDPDAELPDIERRCIVKAEGARWAVRRRQRLADGASYELEIEPTDREIIRKGKEAGTYLWMNNPSGPCPADLSILLDVAGCFETAASALALTRSILNESPLNQDELDRALHLLAEAQSMLRTAVTRAGCEKDSDQTAIHNWLRGATYRHQVFIEGYMKTNESADPKDWPALSTRIEELDKQVEARRSSEKMRRQLFNKLGYHTGRIEKDGPSTSQWERVVSIIDELLQDCGIPPSSVEIRDALLSIIDQLPDIEYPSSFMLVLREIDRFLASRPEPKKVAEDISANAEIREVAGLLRGRKVALIGGYERPYAAKALQEAFELSELNWVASEKHDSLKTFEPDVADPDIALVMLAIRWSSHAYTDLQGYCDKYSKPLVHLPGGYNPAQVAHQILEQASDRLGG